MSRLGFLRPRRSHVRAVVWPASAPKRSEFVVAFITFLVVVRLSHALDSLGAPDAAGGAVLMIACMLYTVRLSRWVLWPSPESAHAARELTCAAVAAVVLGSLLGIALFALGAPDAIAIAPLQLGATVYATTLFVRYELAHGPASVRAAWPMLAALVGVYLAASICAVVLGRPVNSAVFYPAFIGLGGLLLGAIWSGDTKIRGWVGASQFRHGVSIIAPYSIMLSTAAAVLAVALGTDSPALFGLTISGVLVGGGVIFEVLMHPLRQTP